MVETRTLHDVDLDQSTHADRADSRGCLTKVKRATACDTLSHLRSRLHPDNACIP